MTLSNRRYFYNSHYFSTVALEIKFGHIELCDSHPYYIQTTERIETEGRFKEDC